MTKKNTKFNFLNLALKCVLMLKKICIDTGLESHNISNKVQLCLDDTFQVELESYLVSKSLLLAYFYSEHSSTQWMNSIMSWTDANHCH